MRETDILNWLGTNLPYVALGTSVLLFAFIGLLVAFYYRGRALEEALFALEEEEEKAETASKRLEDAFAALHTQAAKAEALDELKPRYDTLQTAFADLKADKAAQEAAMRTREEAVEKEFARLAQVRTEMKEQFDLAANQALNTNRKAFLDLANETFAKHQRSAQADLEGRKEAISQLLAPVKDTLKRYEAGLSSVEKARQEAYGQLTSELKLVASGQAEVRQEAAKLAQAMRAAPKARGRWGEHQLQNIMELSGMAEYVDFNTQVNVDGGEKRQMPDATIRLPGDRTIVVDAKASMSAYLDALDALDEEGRRMHLARHAKQVREHVKQLSAKKYWEALESAPDFVVMFLPNDNLLSVAVDHDPDLLDFGLKQKVLVATPTTFMGFAKAVAYGWRQERMASNAKIIAALGQELYKRLSQLGDKVLATGKHLDRAVGSYNQMVGSLESTVLPQARKFRDLEVEGSGQPIDKIPVIENDAREPAEGRDLVFSVVDELEETSSDTAVTH